MEINKNRQFFNYLHTRMLVKYILASILCYFIIDLLIPFSICIKLLKQNLNRNAIILGDQFVVFSL